ncbi:MAG TPA: putative zinc-binding metallopeptidase [Steroidobacteraceae bacterium]|nr:putative zinc-binding metallopeptidase [Steroidobacteraceae bacterium]
MPQAPFHRIPVRSRRPQARAWEHLADEQLLSLRFCDLRLKIGGSALEGAVLRLYLELAQRGIRFRPHCWLAEEWFSPDGVPGIAVPFYLAHPRLMRLERHFMREVEGGNRNWLMRILRHEAGHAIDTAYRLRRRRRWREVFGPASLPYPDAYRPRPGSRRFVQHLGEWYAQAHPTEDFAETFAVWLKPRSGWRREYLDWPAFRKLEFIDSLLAEIGTARPPVTRRHRIEDIAENTRTLREHYERKFSRYRLPRRSGADELLLRVFTNAPTRRTAPKAASVVRELRHPLRQRIARSGAFSEYLVHQVLRLVVARCDELDLYVRGPRRELRGHLTWLIGRLAESYEERQLPHVTL